MKQNCRADLGNFSVGLGESIPFGRRVRVDQYTRVYRIWNVGRAVSKVSKHVARPNDSQEKTSTQVSQLINPFINLTTPSSHLYAPHGPLNTAAPVVEGPNAYVSIPNGHIPEVGAPVSGVTFVKNWHEPPTNAFATQLAVVWHSWQQSSGVVTPATKFTALPWPLPETLWDASASQLPRLTVEIRVVVVVVVVVWLGVSVCGRKGGGGGLTIGA